MNHALPWPWVRRIWPQVETRGWSFLEQPAQRQKTLWILFWLGALVHMVHVTYLVRHYSVEVPTLDDWAMAPLIVKAHTGQLTLTDIFEQQQEARTVLPKLIFILSAARGHWDVRDQMVLSLISCWLTAAGIFLLLRRSGLSPGAVAICFWLIALTIFSLAQVELWIFASGFPSFLPALFVVTALLALGTLRSTVVKFWLCLTLCTASSFTLANGLLAWGLTFPTLLLVQRPARWRLWLGLWLGVCASCATIYFWGYERPPYHPEFAPAAPSLEYAHFILEFLGGGLAYSFRHHEALATFFGALQLLLYLLALAYTGQRIRDRAFLATVVPWFALGLYSIGSACLAALGRIAYGASYALASRYVPFSLYLTVAVIVLVAIIGREIVASRPTNRSRAWVFGVHLLLALTYLVPYQACAANSHFFLRALSRKDRLARAAVLFSVPLDTSEVIKKTAYPGSADPVTQNAAALDRLKLIRPPLLRTNHVSVLPHEAAGQKRASGFCETVERVGAELYRASGWATLDEKRRPADCVVVAYQDSRDQEWIAFTISDSFEMRADTVKRFRSMDQLWAGWTATFSRSAIPAGAKLSFWAVDADELKLYQLGDQSFSKGP
ncbi:MAG: hypothetical protein QOC70_2172 [Verrucomicrobiota bacterium]|jgi:hypothetical protein